MSNFEDYLMSRGLNLDPVKISEEDPILANDELLREVAEMWETHPRAVTAVLQVRLNAIGKEVLMTAIPQEIGVLRQAIVEVAKIPDCYQKYASEWNKRKTKTTETPPVENSEGTSL